MATSEIDEIVAWCKRHRAFLQLELDMLDSGYMTTTEMRLAGQIDTTRETAYRLRNSIVDLDLLLERYGPDELMFVPE